MDPDKRPARRFVIYVLVLISVVVVFVWWFIPAGKNAHKEAPVDSQVWVHSKCAEPTAAPPEYGNRESISYCANSQCLADFGIRR
jgi:hypothetical protein